MIDASVFRNEILNFISAKGRRRRKIKFGHLLSICIAIPSDIDIMQCSVGEIKKIWRIQKN